MYLTLLLVGDVRLTPELEELELEDEESDLMDSP
jgi:hypothetical protein